MDVPTDAQIPEFHDFLSRLRDCDPVLLHYFREVLIGCLDRRISEDIAIAGIAEIENVLTGWEERLN